MSVVQMLELSDQYLLVIGHMSNMQVFKRLSPEEQLEDEATSISNGGGANGTFDLSVNFNGLLSKLTRTSKPYQPQRGPPPLHECEITNSKYYYVTCYPDRVPEDVPKVPGMAPINEPISFVMLT